MPHMSPGPLKSPIITGLAKSSSIKDNLPHFSCPGPSKAYRVVHTSGLLYPNVDSAENSGPSQKW